MLAEVFEYKTEDVPNGKDDQTSNAEEESEQLQVPCVNLIYSTAEKVSPPNLLTSKNIGILLSACNVPMTAYFLF